MLQRRFMGGLTRFDQPVFPDTVVRFRDPSNTSRDLKEAFGVHEGLSWITSHNFRKTTATILNNACLSARTVADQLGHARPSMTQDVYLARRVASPMWSRSWSRSSPARGLAEPIGNDQPNCPTEDSCAVDYRNGERHVAEVVP